MPMAIRIEEIIVGQLDVNCYIVSDGSGPEAIIIDPGDEAERIMAQHFAGNHHLPRRA